MEMSKETDEIIPALHAAWSELENPPRNETVKTKKFSYDYTTLDTLLEHVKPVLQDHGLTLVQTTQPIEGRPHVVTSLLHDSVQRLSSMTPIMCKTEDPQDFGAGMTYARRYSLSALLGIASEDDDDSYRTQHSGVSKGSSGGTSSGGGGGGKMSEKSGTVTEKQLNAIHAIADGKVFSPDETDKKFVGKDEIKAYIKKSRDLESLKKLSKAKASKLIDWLKDLPSPDETDEPDPDEILDDVEVGDEDEIPF